MPAEAESAYFDRYQLLLNLGWHTANPEDTEKLRAFAEKGGVSVGGAAVGADPGVFRRGQIFHLGGDHVLVQDPLCNLRANTVKEGVYFDPPFQRPFFAPETA